MAHYILLSIAEPPAESSIPTRVVLHLWIVPLDFLINPKTKCEKTFDFYDTLADTILEEQKDFFLKLLKTISISKPQ